jgi:hypothetical protein
MCSTYGAVPYGLERKVAVPGGLCRLLRSVGLLRLCYCFWIALRCFVVLSFVEIVLDIVTGQVSPGF